MSKATILDRLAGAMKTLGKREGKALTPRQRVAAAQRWNSLADIGENEAYRPEYGPGYQIENEMQLRDMGLKDHFGPYRASNPFRFDWMGEPYQYEARLRNYRPLTDTQYERMLEIEDKARQRDIDEIHQEWYNDFIEPWRY